MLQQRALQQVFPVESAVLLSPSSDEVTMKVDNTRSSTASAMSFSEADPILEAKAADSLWQKYTKTILINISFLALVGPLNESVL
jgi:hypothetical protein